MLLDGLAVRLVAQSAHPVLRVAVDGPDGAGKTTFADELAAVLGERGREVIRASVDSFHQPHAVRYRLDQDLPKGFYRGSYDYAGLRRALLDFGAAAIVPARLGRCQRRLFPRLGRAGSRGRGCFSCWIRCSALWPAPILPPCGPCCRAKPP